MALVLVVVIFLNHNPYVTTLHPTDLSDFIFSLIMPIFWFAVALFVVYKWHDQEYEHNLVKILNLVGLIILAFILVASTISFSLEPHDDISSLQHDIYNDSAYNESFYYSDNGTTQNNGTNYLNSTRGRYNESAHNESFYSQDYGTNFQKSTGGSFENQWVKFSYPSNLTIVDESTDDEIMIKVYNGTEQVGCINNLPGGVNSYLASGSFNITQVDGRVAGFGETIHLTHTKESGYLSQVLDDLSVNGTDNIYKYDFNNITKSIVGVTASIFGFQVFGDQEPSETAVVSLRDGASLNFDFLNNNKISLNQIVTSLKIKKDEVKYIQNDQNDELNVSSGGKFENKWVKFEYPPGITVLDRSKDDKLELHFINNTESIGDMNSEEMGVSSDDGNIIAGRRAEFNAAYTSDFFPMPFARIELNNTHSISFEVFPGNETVYNQVIKTLIIKQGNSTRVIPHSNLNLKQKIDYNSTMIFFQRNTKIPVPINYSSFENQWIKFNYPSYLNVTDHSTDNSIEVVLLNETGEVGSIRSRGMTINNSVPSSDPNAPQPTTIAGRDALNGVVKEGYNVTLPSSEIKLNHDAVLHLCFYSGTEPIYDSVVNSFIIKRNDIKINQMQWLLDIYNFFKQFLVLTISPNVVKQ